MKDYTYNTESESINTLKKRGYSAEFSVSEDGYLVCNGNETRLLPNEFKIDEIYRFEGDSNPSDETIVLAISSTKHNINGVLIDAYGTYANSATTKVINQLKKRI